MATLKQRLHRKNSSGTYDTIHLETSADLIVGTLGVAHGGTGATDAATARTNLGAAASSHNHSAANITSGTLPISRGGTGATTAANARTNLGAAASSHTHPASQVTAGNLPVGVMATNSTDYSTSRIRNIRAGTGAAPMIAGLTREKEILTIAVVTKPFNFEGRRRMENAEKGLKALREVVDSLVIIPNEKLFKLVPKGTSIVETFRYADDVLRQGVQGISNLIIENSLINLDFADVRTTMKNRGLAHMGIGRAKGERRIFEALSQAVSSPLLETTIEGATGIIFNVKGGSSLPIDQVHEAADLMREIVDPNCNIIFGASIDESLEDTVEITVIATGFQGGPSLIEKDDYVADANDNVSQQKYAEFLANRIESGKVSADNLGEEEKELVGDFKQSQNQTQNKTSRIAVDFDESDIPPFLRKLKGK